MNSICGPCCPGFHPDNRVGCDLFILVPAVYVVEKDCKVFQNDYRSGSKTCQLHHLYSELKLWQQFCMQKAQHEIPSNISDTLISTDEDNIRVLLIIGSMSVV